MKRLSIATRLAIIGWVFLPLAFVTFFHTYYTVQQMTVTTWAGYAGRLQARQHFHQGKYRIYTLAENAKSEYTGKVDGPFEIWTWTIYPEMRWFHETEANQTFVNDYNRVMRRMWMERQHTNSAEPTPPGDVQKAAPEE